MLGFQLFNHAMGMVSRNFGAAFQIFLVPCILSYALTFEIRTLAGEPMSANTDLQGVQERSIAFTLDGILSFLVSIFVTIWTVVA